MGISALVVTGAGAAKTVVLWGDARLAAVVLGHADASLSGQPQAFSAADLDRLTHYHIAVTGQAPHAGFEFPAGGAGLPAEVILTAAQEIMALRGKADPQALFARKNSILARAASRVRAENEPSPATLRHKPLPGDVTQVGFRQPYARFFAVEERDISWRRFDGKPFDPVVRAAFVSADAVTVLPYDPRRDRVLVIEQFRAGPHARGDAQAWQIEAIAGRVDAGETPEAAARREAVEEAGLTLGEMHKVAGYYPSPGILTEFIYSYVALADLPDGAAGIFGLAEEHEDIRGHLLSVDQLLALIGSGEVSNSPLILTAWWLAAHRVRLGAG